MVHLFGNILVKSYLKWIGEDLTDVTFFGHSLGKTDFDVLRELFSIKSARYKVCKG